MVAGGGARGPCARSVGQVGDSAHHRCDELPGPDGGDQGRLQGYTSGDTDLAWSRITYWRALLAAALDQAPHEPITSAVVSGLQTEPALDIMAGWLATRIDGPVRREVGELKVELVRNSETITLAGRRPE